MTSAVPSLTRLSVRSTVTNRRGNTRPARGHAAHQHGDTEDDDELKA
jgi:hypothetical protein